MPVGSSWGIRYFGTIIFFTTCSNCFGRFLLEEFFTSAMSLVLHSTLIGD